MHSQKSSKLASPALQSRISVRVSENGSENTASPTLNPKINNKSGIQDDSILVKTCCPNCRYVFQIVDHNKLGSGTSRVYNQSGGAGGEKYQYDREQHTREFYINTPSSSEQDQVKTVEKGEGKRSQTPRFYQKSPKMSKKPETSTTRNKTPSKQISRKAQTIAVSPTTNRCPSPTPKISQPLNPNNFQTPINNLNISQHPPRYRQELNEESMKIRKDIDTMKMILNMGNYDKGLLKSQNISRHENAVEDRANLSADGENPILPLQNYSSIPRRYLELRRKCPHCQSGAIQIETVLCAAKSTILQNDLQMLARHVDRDTSTPSYIKCLQQSTLLTC